MSDDVKEKITAIIARMPEWLRQELASKESSTRERAEEALSAMIAAALTDADLA
jgi:hypothetical protein